MNPKKTISSLELVKKKCLILYPKFRTIIFTALTKVK